MNDRQLRNGYIDKAAGHEHSAAITGNFDGARNGIFKPMSNPKPALMNFMQPVGGK